MPVPRTLIAAMMAVVAVGAATISIARAVPPQYIVKTAAGSGDSPADRPVMPDQVFTDAGGSPIHLAHFGGEVIVINFWATWCGPCIEEMTFLDRLQGDFKGKPLQVLAISEDRGGVPVAKSFFARQKVTFLKPYADPNGSMAQSLHVQGLPTSYVLDKHGRVVSYVNGPTEWDNPKILATFYALMVEQ